VSTTVETRVRFLRDMLTRLGLAAKVDVIRNRFFGCDAGELTYYHRHARDPLGEARGSARAWLPELSPGILHRLCG